jgi:hypothetical protein
MESAYNLRRKADAAVRAGRFAEAADLYRREAAVYRRNGDLNAAKVEETKADRFTSTIRLFATRREVSGVPCRRTAWKSTSRFMAAIWVPLLTGTNV